MSTIPQDILDLARSSQAELELLVKRIRAHVPNSTFVHVSPCFRWDPCTIHTWRVFIGIRGEGMLDGEGASFAEAITAALTPKPPKEPEPRKPRTGAGAGGGRR